jgi:MoxR-like ATPase
LPEAQLDRFLIRVSLGYPDFAEELAVIERQERIHPIETLEAVATPEDVVQLQAAAREVYVDGLVREYIVSLSEASRNHEDVSLGASPRASLGMFRIARAYALVHDRDYVVPDDVQTLAYGVMGHRIILSPAARMRRLQSREVIDRLLDSVPIPGAVR